MEVQPIKKVCTLQLVILCVSAVCWSSDSSVTAFSCPVSVAVTVGSAIAGSATNYALITQIIITTLTHELLEESIVI